MSSRGEPAASPAAVIVSLIADAVHADAGGEAGLVVMDEDLGQAKAIAQRLQPAQHKGRPRPRRCLSEDYERRCATGEAFIDTTMTRLMLRRVAHAAPFSDGF